MAYTPDPYDDTRPVGADDAGGLTQELRSIKTELKGFRDNVTKDYYEFQESLEEKGLPIELGGTGVQTLEKLKDLLGITNLPQVGIGGLVAFGAGTHLWQIPNELKGTNRRFIVALAGAGGGGYNDTGSESGGWGGDGGLAITITTTSQTSLQVVIGQGSAGSAGSKPPPGTKGGDSSFSNILTATGGYTAGSNGRSGRRGTATGGILNITGGGGRGGVGAFKGDPGSSHLRGNDGFCIILW